MELDSCPTAIEIADAVRNGRQSAVEQTEAAFNRIEATNSTLDAFTHLAREEALAEAADVDRRVAGGDDLPLAGVPIGVKELDFVEGWPDTSGSALFADGIATRSDTHVTRLRRAGAVLVGLTSASEFGITAYTHHPARGLTARNPWSLDHSPGGSSGGSAAAVAAGVVPLATGGDGGGSIRLPASLCGLVGPKMAVGRTPRRRRDLWTTAVLGPLATTVADAARYLDATVGPDGFDRGELPHPGVSYEGSLDEALVRDAPDRPLRAVWVPDFGFSRVEAEVLALTERAARDLVAGSPEIEWVDRRIEFRDPSSAWSLIGAPGSLRSLGKAGALDAIDTAKLSREGRWSLRGSPQVDAASMARAIDRIDEVVTAIEDAFADVDLILSPAAAVSSVPAEGPLPTVIDGDEVKPSAIAHFTIPFNLSGHPGVSVPAGRTINGHPVGLQIAGHRFSEVLLLQLAHRFEQLHPWPRTAPSVRA
jgi:aspartyl-tRNA(Asn)/glutamyl-tRNA(Gln) amidotransferase subunit A